jgi:Zn-dependent M28 family amino/carboxypeptidase
VRGICDLVVFGAALLLLPNVAVAQTAARAVATESRAHVERLASPQLDGRLTGSAGADAAAAYLVEQLVKLGAKPLPGAANFRTPFHFTSGVTDEGTTLEITAPGREALRRQGRPSVVALSFSDASSVSGAVVFAGYGLRVPGEQGFTYDSYAGLDVKDKIVVVLRYFPEDAERELKQSLARYAGLRYKAMAARERGAKGLLVITGPRSTNAGELVPLTLDTAAAGSGIAAASVAGDVATALFAGAGRSLEDTQKALDSGNPHVTGFDLKDVTASLTTRVVRQTQTTHNIVGYLPATTTLKSKPWVMLGAHYDHLGHGGQGTSLAHADEQQAVHPGADDNASGVAAVLTAGRALAAARSRARHIVLAFWSGEEIGLIGSSAFVAQPPFPIDQVAAALNFDMVGRLRNNTVTVQAVGSSSAWPTLLDRVTAPGAHAAAALTLARQQDPNLPTDSSSFNQAGVPTLSFFTGSHEDYHRPTDVAARIDFQGIDRIAALGAAIAADIAAADAAPPFVRVAESTGGRGGREVLRVSTGTIPDYATEVAGLLLGGVVAGGPAEQAGLRKGDIIVEIAGQTIANIYDYTYALDVLKPDVPATVAFMRDGQRQTTTLTPRARK